MEILLYLIVSSVCLSLFYGVYRLIYSHEANFRHQRMYLLLSAAISLLLPLLPQRIDMGIHVAGLLQAEKGPQYMLAGRPGSFMIPGFNGQGKGPFSGLPEWVVVAGFIWFIVTVVLLLRMGIMTAFILIRANHASSDQIYGCRIVKGNWPQSPFSFFRIIFLPDTIACHEEVNHIIAHEKVHALQWHSLDRILFEILTAIMWFNPWGWKMKQSLTLVHEYLADEGALKSGVDRQQYQALLINQVAGAPLITLSSRFNHSIIKKRILMMTQKKHSRTSRFRILALTPLTFILLIGVACLNGLFAQPGKTEMKMSTSEVENSPGPDSIQVKTNASLPQNILYLVDGKEVSAEVVQAIDPNTIESVDVIKDKEMIKKYTSKNVEGVIVITSKAAAKK